MNRERTVEFSDVIYYRRVEESCVAAKEMMNDFEDINTLFNVINKKNYLCRGGGGPGHIIYPNLTILGMGADPVLVYSAWGAENVAVYICTL